VTFSSQLETAVTEEGEGEFGVGPDPSEPVLGVDGSFVDGVGAEVGELA
jgi:hypothetical protein